MLNIDIDFETFPQLGEQISPLFMNPVAMRLARQGKRVEFGNPDQIVVVDSPNGSHILVGQLLGCRADTVIFDEYHEDGQMSGYVEAAMALHRYVEIHNAERRYTPEFEIVPKKIPKTYGPPRIGKRGKVCKW